MVNITFSNFLKRISDIIIWWIPVSSLRPKARAFFHDFCYSSTIKTNNIKISKVNWWSTHIENKFYKDEPIVHVIYDFLMEKNKVLEYNTHKSDIHIFSVFGDADKIKNSDAAVKIFYMGEPCSDPYKDYHLNDVDLSLGFWRLDHDVKNYFRFPLWLRNFLSGSENFLDKDYILKYIMNFNKSNFTKTKFCSLIARADGNNFRTSIVNALNSIEDVSCAGQLLHNDNSLITKYKNNKKQYLKQFKFNICPENTLQSGYITEKLMDAFECGCIPIWNGDPYIEGDVINKNAILYWQRDDDNKDILKEIEKLHKDDKLYNAFISQPRFNEDAAVDYIYTQTVKLKEKIENLIEKKILNK